VRVEASRLLPRADEAPSLLACVLVDTRAKELGQVHSSDTQDVETVVEVVAVAVVGIGYVEVLAVIEEIAPQDDVGAVTHESAPHVVSMFARHNDDEVLSIEEIGVGEDAEGTWSGVASSVQRAAGARVHGASDVPVCRPGARDDYVIFQKRILGDQVS
jgi:hypothetical protein